MSFKRNCFLCVLRGVLCGERKAASAAFAMLMVGMLVLAAAVAVLPLPALAYVSQGDSGDTLGYGLDFDGTDDYLSAGTSSFSSSAGTYESWVSFDNWASGNTETIFSAPSEGQNGQAESETIDGTTNTQIAQKFTAGSSYTIKYVELYQKSGTEGEVVDASGQGNHGTAWTGTSTTSGRFGNAGYFEGSDYVDCGNDPTLYPTSITILSEDVWYHLAMTCDNSGFRLYVNGILEDTDIGGGIEDTENTGNYNIGRMPYATKHFYGKIDEVRIYNHALSADEVRSHYLGGIAMHKNSDNNLVFHAGNAVLTTDVSGLSGWHYVAGTYASNDVRLWLDGKQVAQDTSVTVTSGLNFDSSCYFANDEKNAMEFSGVMDEVRVLNYAKTGFGGGE